MSSVTIFTRFFGVVGGKPRCRRISHIFSSVTSGTAAHALRSFVNPAELGTEGVGAVYSGVFGGKVAAFRAFEIRERRFWSF